MSLVEVITRAKSQNEAKLLAEVQPPKHELDESELAVARRFVTFCKTRGVTSLPAVPVTVAAWIRSEHSLGVSAEHIAEGLTAIIKMHDAAAQSNPVATSCCQVELNRITETEGKAPQFGSNPPRSWSKEEHPIFYSLSPKAKAIIVQRAHQQSTEIRRVQNEAAELVRLAQNEAAELRKQLQPISAKDNANAT